MRPLLKKRTLYPNDHIDPSPSLFPKSSRKWSMPDLLLQHSIINSNPNTPKRRIFTLISKNSEQPGYNPPYVSPLHPCTFLKTGTLLTLANCACCLSVLQGPCCSAWCPRCTQQHPTLSTTYCTSITRTIQSSCSREFPSSFCGVFSLQLPFNFISTRCTSAGDWCVHGNSVQPSCALTRQLSAHTQRSCTR